MSHEARDEIHAKIRAENREIDAAVDELIPEYLDEIEWALQCEFGNAIMRGVDLGPFQTILERLARAASNRTMAITSNKRLGEERAKVGGILSALIDVSRNKEEGRE